MKLVELRTHGFDPDQVIRTIENAAKRPGNVLARIWRNPLRLSEYAPEEGHWSTPGNTSNSDRHVTEIVPGLYWVACRGWTGDRDDTDDQLWYVNPALVAQEREKRMAHAQKFQRQFIEEHNRSLERIRQEAPGGTLAKLPFLDSDE